MKAILNVIWLVLEGLWMAIAYVIAGVVCFILIITIPFGIASFRIANYVLWPFGRTIDPGVTPRLGDREHHLDHPVWLVAGGRASGERRGAVHHDHRHPARPGQLQDHPDHAVPARGGDRPHGPGVLHVLLGRRPGRLSGRGPR